MTAAWVPSLVLWIVTAAVAAGHTLRFYRFAFGEISPVAAPISAVLVALLAMVVYPLAFFSAGAFAMEPAAEALGWLERGGRPLSGEFRATISATADGALAAAFTYFVAFGSAAAVMGAMACASRHLMRSRSV
jgi:hypothetical protein